ncbi:hypothetical protein V8G61_15000 [Gaetbulibacter sp. M240]|uniref:hypothetical protein n=1 Tax=Gaetbulibacter sp. M240 TaxID=3126511 RepID=UPI00374F5133
MKIIRKLNGAPKSLFILLLILVSSCSKVDPPETNPTIEIFFIVLDKQTREPIYDARVALNGPLSCGGYGGCASGTLSYGKSNEKGEVTITIKEKYYFEIESVSVLIGFDKYQAFLFDPNLVELLID